MVRKSWGVGGDDFMHIIVMTECRMTFIGITILVTLKVTKIITQSTATSPGRHS